MSKLSQYRPLFVIGFLCLIFVQAGLVITGFSKVRPVTAADFRSFYAAGYLIRTGHGEQIYDYNKTAATEAEVIGPEGANLPFIHPAYEGVLFAALSIFSYKKAFTLFFLVNLGLLVVVYRLMLPAAAWTREIWSGLPALTIAGFLPVGACLMQGQDSILFLAIVTVSYVLQKNQRDFLAGVVLGLGMFRFQLVIPLAICLCFGRRWKLSAGLAVACAIVAAISIAVTQPASWMAYPRHLMAMNAGLQTELEKLAHAIYPEKMPNLRGLFYLLLGTRVGSGTMQLLTAVASVALMGWAIAKRLPFELLVVVAVLVSYHSAIHDSALLLLPLLKLPISLARGKRLLAWSLTIAAPALALFAFHAPLAVVSIVYLIFLAMMAKPASEAGEHMVLSRSMA
ncbi:MAG TPA: glycosyltransferase family 87 protein [Candidatus Acidoferrum sp.]|jgi:hypothetical protein